MFTYSHSYTSFISSMPIVGENASQTETDTGKVFS